MTTVLMCAVPKCTSQYTTTEATTESTKFICSKHSPAAMKKALQFQQHAFDRELDGEIKENESRESDRDWGMSGEPIAAGEKCEHGVYDPTEDQRYCTVCKPAKLTLLARVEKRKWSKVGIIKNPTEQQEQAHALLLFYYTLPESQQPAWFRDPELGFKSAAKRAFTPQLKANKIFGRDQWEQE